MSNKITDARIKELERLTGLKRELKEKIQNERDAMQAIADAMEEDKTGALISSSSKAAREARGKESTTLSDEDALEACEIAIQRLEEQFAKVEDEMRGIEELMKSDL